MFRNVQLVLAISLGFVLCTRATAADDEAKAKAKDKKGVAGVIESVSKDSITIKVMGKKKGSGSDSDTADREKTFKINDATTYVTVSKGDNGPEMKDAKFDDLKSGERVRIVTDGDVAQKIEILPKGKKKNETE
jgi:hypothetical protein